MPAEAKARLISTAAGQHSTAHGRDDVAQDGHDAQEGARVEGAAQDAPAELAQRDVGDAQGRRQHGVVGLGDLELEEDEEGRVEHGAVHGRRRQEAGRHEGRVGDLAAVDVDRADEVRQPDADGEQVEERLEEARDDEDPRAPVDQDVALEHPGGVAPPEEGERRDARRHARRPLVEGGAEPVEVVVIASHHQPLGEGPPAGGVADGDQRAQVGGMPEVGPAHLAERQVAAQRHPVVERRARRPPPPARSAAARSGRRSPRRGTSG